MALKMIFPHLKKRSTTTDFNQCNSSVKKRHLPPIPEVKEPKAVRYGWANNPEVNLYNKENLPTSPFRTDNWSEKP